MQKWRRSIISPSYKIILTEIFKQEVQEIIFYLEFFLKEPITASRLHKSIIESISKLDYFPEGYFKINNSKNLNLHRILVNNYIIIYNVNKSKKEIYISHIFHNTQNYLNLL